MGAWGIPMDLIWRRGFCCDPSLKLVPAQVDEFLGQAVLPLREFDVYERPRSRWAGGERREGFVLYLNLSESPRIRWGR